MGERVDFGRLDDLWNGGKSDKVSLGGRPNGREKERVRLLRKKCRLKRDGGKTRATCGRLKRKRRGEREFFATSRNKELTKILSVPDAVL